MKSISTNPIRKKTIITVLTGILVCSALYAANEFSVAQKNKSFSVKTLDIKVGDTVSFPNEDDFFHNVYSLSPAKIFDLGSYKKGETKKVIFDKAGIITVQCAIHPEMKMEIVVK
ncbi:methylamine utilization protein [Leptospira ilyithenensis]|uniref:Methylamine utilization protein n=1 Tax=Leptospira ilyithenensis TaxID=2484901 RepID=A0A4R9LQE5_9LEPT|nr:methylamine utilization protein [Leptospira ilyithenensis]TGN08421.1 methylamine utilization protein [Leptospira ilyithenensis]